MKLARFHAAIAVFFFIACRQESPDVPQVDRPDSAADSDVGTDTTTDDTTSDSSPGEPPELDDVAPTIIDPAGGSHLVLRGADLDSVTTVWIGDVQAASFEHVDDATLTVLTPAVGSGVGLPVLVDGSNGSATWAGTLEAWSPAEIEGARVFDAGSGVEGAETACTYQWARLTEEISPDWIVRDGPGLVWIPSTERFWMIAGWNGYEPPTGWGSDITTNEVWSSPDGVTWQQELEHGNTEFVRRHFQGTIPWRDRVYLVGGDIFYAFTETGQYSYQHDIVSTANGLDWRVDLEQTPWSDRIFEVAGIYNDQMWVFGGQTGLSSDDGLDPAVFHNDVWRSDDGVVWEEVAPDGEPSATRPGPRGIISKMVEFHGELWLVGGGTYDTYSNPTRLFYNDVWSTADGLTWTQHATAPWLPREYHSVEVFDGKLWVIGGCHESTCNSNDAWYSSDGETWTDISYMRSPLPLSHADGVAVGPDSLVFAGGNYSYGVDGEDRSTWRLRAFNGTAVDRWVDRGSGLVVTASGDARPVLDANALGEGAPGLVFDGEHHALRLATSDLQDAGRSVFWVGQSPYNTGAVAAYYGPQNVVVGDPESPYCAAGFTDSSIAYVEGTDGWDTLQLGDGYRDGPGEVVCVGFSAGVNGDVTGWADGVQVGDTYAMGYTVGQEDWSAIGEGYSGTNKYVGALGAVIILPGAADATVAARIHTWAQGRFYAR